MESKRYDDVRLTAPFPHAVGGTRGHPISVWVLAMLVHGLQRGTFAVDVVCSLSFPLVGMFLSIYGSQRPWDLEVVERLGLRDD